MDGNELLSWADYVIIGGGVMGASTAYHLALAGAKKIVLLERAPFFGTGATGRCAGGVRYQFGTEVNIRLSIASMKMIEQFEVETGQASGYRPCGYLFVLTKPEDVVTFKRNVALQNRLGVATEWLSGGEVRRRLPMMHFPDAIGGTFHAKDGLADPNSIVMGYIKRARELGVTAVTDTTVTDIKVEKGRVTAVYTNKGNISCQQVINAAGPWAGLIGKMAGVEIPITPVRRQMITTTSLVDTTPLDLPPDFPFVIDFAQSLYFHREGEGILTGMSNPNQAAGFNQDVDAEWEMVALEAGMQRLPLLEKAGRLSGWAGLYEVTPDAHPIIGKTAVYGFWVVGGFSGHGFMHGPIAGKLMSELILYGQAESVDIEMLDLARFNENRHIYEYNVV